jgi:hypothetical protein
MYILIYIEIYTYTHIYVYIYIYIYIYAYIGGIGDNKDKYLYERNMNDEKTYENFSNMDPHGLLPPIHMDNESDNDISMKNNLNINQLRAMVDLGGLGGRGDLCYSYMYMYMYIYACVYIYKYIFYVFVYIYMH